MAVIQVSECRQCVSEGQHAALLEAAHGSGAVCELGERQENSIYIEIFANVMPGTKLAFMEHFRV